MLPRFIAFKTRPQHLCSPAPLLLGALLLSACGNDSTLAVAGKAIRNAAFPKQQPDISRDSVSKLPYAMITARVGKGEPALLVLGHSTDGTQQWMATNEVSVTTRNGRAIRTVGFPYELGGLKVFGDDPLANAPHRMTGTAVYRKSIDVYGTERQSAVTVCALDVAGPATITIVEIEFQTIRLEETCAPDDSGNTRTSLESTYWVDIYDGFVWQSLQRWHKDQPALAVSVLKPERRR